MITKKEICDILKKKLPKEITILPNRIPNNKEKTISVNDSNLDDTLSFRGSKITFNKKSFSLIIRYNTNETETENFCNELYTIIKDIKDEEINNKNKWLYTLKIIEPKATGNVKNNIYEQKIEFSIIYSL